MVVTVARAMVAVAGVSTPAGPMSDAVMAAVGSDVLRHAQGCESLFGVDVRDGLWCIGHICPSPCSQVHSAPTAAAALGGQSAVGIETSRQSWNTSHAEATKASRGRIQSIAVQTITTRSRQSRQRPSRAETAITPMAVTQNVTPSCTW